MIDRWEAQLIAASWVYQGARPGAAPGIGIDEFDLGYVCWRAGTREPLGAGRVVVDRTNGELTHWPSVPAEVVAQRYRAYRAEYPASPLTWDPVARARHDRLRAPFPENVTHLRLADGRLRTARSMRGGGTPNLHPLVRAARDQQPLGSWVRGSDRCSEVAVLSDLLHAEDARRVAAGAPRLSTQVVRDELLRGANLVTYQVREPGDPLDGRPALPCGSCQALLHGLGFAPPGEPR